MRSTQDAVITAIRLHLAARNKTQGWLANRLGRSAFWVTRRMTGDVSFDANSLDDIAGVFGLSVAELLEVADAVPVRAEAVAS